MAHNLIVGMTESGKTTLAKLMAKEFRKSGIKVAVLDPLNDPGWDADFQTSDPVEFLRYCKKNKKHVLFVDEGGTSIGRYNDEMEWLATQSRHWGHACFFISQRAVQMVSTIRHQCSKAFIFAVGENDSKMFAEEWRESELKNLSKMQKGEFVIVSRFAALQYGRVDFSAGRVYLGNPKRSPDATKDSQSGNGRDAKRRNGKSKSNGNASDASA